MAAGGAHRGWRVGGRAGDAAPGAPQGHRAPDAPIAACMRPARSSRFRPRRVSVREARRGAQRDPAPRLLGSRGVRRRRAASRRASRRASERTCMPILNRPQRNALLPATPTTSRARSTSPPWRPRRVPRRRARLPLVLRPSPRARGRPRDGADRAGAEIERCGELVRIEIAADGFLHHMVRMIVGTLLECGAAGGSPARPGAPRRGRPVDRGGPRRPPRASAWPAYGMPTATTPREPRPCSGTWPRRSLTGPGFPVGYLGCAHLSAEDG